MSTPSPTSIWEYGRNAEYAAAAVEALGLAHSLSGIPGLQMSNHYATVANVYATLHLAEMQNPALSRLHRNPQAMQALTEANVSGATVMHVNEWGPQ